MTINQRFLLFAIGTLFTLLMISGAVLIYNKTLPFIETTNKKLSSQARMYADSIYMPYDSQIVTGSNILTAYRQYADTNNFFLYVQTNNGGTFRNFGLSPMGLNTTCQGFNFTTAQLSNGTMSCNVSESQVIDSTNNYYVSPQARFKSVIVRDTNKRVYGIYFQML